MLLPARNAASCLFARYKYLYWSSNRAQCQYNWETDRPLNTPQTIYPWHFPRLFAKMLDFPAEVPRTVLTSHFPGLSAKMQGSVDNFAYNSPQTFPPPVSENARHRTYPRQTDSGHFYRPFAKMQYFTLDSPRTILPEHFFPKIPILADGKPKTMQRAGKKRWTT